MKAITCVILWVFISVCGNAQNFNITFTGTGASTQIDSITATNLTTNQSVTLPGDETLVLTRNTGVPAIKGFTDKGIVFPNPFSGLATFTTFVQNPQTVMLKVLNLVGQVLAHTNVFVESGENEFVLSVDKAGIYMVNLTTDQGINSYKIISTEASQAGNRIQYHGSVSNNHHNPIQPEIKSSQTAYTLGFSTDDIIHYRCMAGIYTTIMTDSTDSSRNYEVEFNECYDPDGKNYSIVKIGDQTWMAENLAYLPAVSSSSEGSETSANFYVYDYEGRSVEDAKANSNYSKYGVLYNWRAAMIICPDGWHLPNDAEWSTFSDYLGPYTGNKIKSQSGWAGSIGNGDNSTGFNALPAGYRGFYGGFESQGNSAYFLSASEEDPTLAWSRYLYYLSDGSLYRNTTNKAMGSSVRCVMGPSLPTVSTAGISNVTEESATCGGEVSFEGSSEVIVRGVCWNTVGNPTILDNKTSDGEGPGEFTSELTELTIGAFYYVRAYATSSAGTSYGEQNKFSTTGETGTFTDSRDGHEYNWVKIGDQTWMAENLAYLPAVSPSSIGSTEEKVYYVYDYQGSDIDSAKINPNYSKYGVLYNWPAAMNGAAGSDSLSGVQGVCPEGWHLPSGTEWNQLIDFLGISPGGKIKETGTLHWYSPNTGATNESGFTSRGGGARSIISGTFTKIMYYACYWTSTIHTYGAKYLYQTANWDGIIMYGESHAWGYSVRCLKD